MKDERNVVKDYWKKRYEKKFTIGSSGHVSLMMAIIHLSIGLTNAPGKGPFSLRGGCGQTRF